MLKNKIMITISILFILIYSYSLYTIKGSKPWEDFNPFESSFLLYMLFILGTGLLSIGIFILMFYIVYTNVLP